MKKVHQVILNTTIPLSKFESWVKTVFDINIKRPELEKKFKDEIGEEWIVPSADKEHYDIAFAIKADLEDLKSALETIKSDNVKITAYSIG